MEFLKQVGHVGVFPGKERHVLGLDDLAVGMTREKLQLRRHHFGLFVDKIGE